MDSAMAMSTREAKPRLGSSNVSINELFRLDDRTIIITGGGGAVGLEVAKSVVESGGDAICLDMSESPLQDEWHAAHDAAERHGQYISYYTCDITDEQALATTFEEAMQNVRYPLRGLVTCHGISAGGSAMTFPKDTVSRLLDVNFTGTFSVAQLCAREFQESGRAGSIVLIASMSAHGSNKGVDTAAYNSSKAAVVQLARSLAAEWGSKKDCPLIRVNTMSPGYIRTRQTFDTLAEPGIESQWSQDNMMLRLSYADEYRGAIQFLLSDASSFVTGSDLRVDGGHTAW